MITKLNCFQARTLLVSKTFCSLKKKKNIYFICSFTWLLKFVYKKCQLTVKSCHLDAQHVVHRQWDFFAQTTKTLQLILNSSETILKQHSCFHANTLGSMDAPGFLIFCLCFISFSWSQCFFYIFNLWSHYLLTHLSSSKWFLFISWKLPNQSWKLNATQKSHCFQLRSLSLWEWMAAAENSDVLPHHDGESLNVSNDLLLLLYLTEGLGRGDLTNHVTHLAHYIRILYLLPVSFSHPLSVSLTYVLLIGIISACWKEHRQKGGISFNLKLVVSLCNDETSAPRRV